MSLQLPRLEVLYEDNHLLAVNKPAMLPTMGVQPDRPNLLAIAKEYIAKVYDKPGNVYLGVVSRLDAPVTGVLLIARTSKAASRLSEAFRSRSVVKSYWAAVEGETNSGSAEVVHYLRKDDRHRRVHTTHVDCPGAQLAKLAYSALSTTEDASLLKVTPETGRKHQIRVQLAKLGHSIIGDRKYGAVSQFFSGIALHSRRLEFEHPVQRQPMVIEAPVPKSWRTHPITANLLDDAGIDSH